MDRQAGTGRQLPLTGGGDVGDIPARAARSARSGRLFQTLWASPSERFHVATSQAVFVSIARPVPISDRDLHGRVLHDHVAAVDEGECPVALHDGARGRVCDRDAVYLGHYRYRLE